MERNEVRSCCLRVDLNAIVIFFSIFFVTGAICLSVYKLIVETDCNSTTPYYILLTNQASFAAAAIFNLIRKRQPDYTQAAVSV